MRILIVEDNLAVRDLLDDVLTDQGYDTDIAGDGQAGVERAKARPPDLVLMDLQLPVLDGVTATWLLRRDPSTRMIPVIAMSADDRLRRMGASIPADGLLPKPFDLDDLLTIVGQSAPASRRSARITCEQ